MKTKIRVLHVDDNMHDRLLVKDTLVRDHDEFEVIEADNREKFEKLLDKGEFDLILSDFNILGFDGLQVLEMVKKKQPGLPVIVVTGTGSEEVAIQAMKMGASDYVIKSVRHIQGLVPTIKAVLEHKKSEEDRINALRSLRESEEMYRSIYENSSIAILLTTPDGKILSANDFACKLFGKTEKEICDSGREGLIDIKSPGLQALLDERASTGKAEGELTFLKKDGSRFQGEVSSVVFLDKDGNQKTSMVIRDLTEQRKAEEVIRTNEARFRSYFESSVAGIALTSPQAGWIEVNDRLCEMLGYTRDELLGTNWPDLTHPDDLNIDLKNFNKVLKGKIEGYSIDKRFIRKDGNFIWTSLSVRCVRRPDGSVEYLIKLLFDISERKQTESALYESEHRLSSIYQTVGDVIFHLAVEAGDLYRFISVNQAFMNVTGLSEEMVVGKLVNEVIPEPSLSMVLEKYKQAIKENSIIRWEEISDNPTGRLIGDVSIAPVIDDKGICTHLVGSVHDITERKRAENALHESEEYNRLLFNTSPIGLAVCRIDGSLVDINPAFAKIIGRTVEETLKLSYRDITPEKYTALEEEQLKSLKKTGYYGKYEKEFIHKDGHLVPVLLQGIILERNNGQFIWSSVEDISKRKEAEIALQKSQHLFKTLTEVSPVGIFRTARDGRTTYVNPKWLEISGLTYDEAMDFGWLKAIHPDDREKLEKTWNAAFQSHKASTAEYRFLRPDGSIVWVIGNAVPELIDNEIVSYIGTITDITERKLAEESLKQHQDVIRRERIMLRTFIDNLPAPVSFKDSEGRYILNNTAHLKLIGAGKQEDATGKTTFDFFPEAEAMEYDKDDKYVLSTGKMMLGKEENAIDKQTGKTYWHLTNKIPLTDANSKVTHLITISQDITQQKLIEEELKKNQTQLLNALKLAHLGSWEYDVENDIFIFNDLFYAIFRTTAEGVGGYTMTSAEYANRFIHPEDMALVGLETRKAIETDDPNFSRQLEHRIIYADGETGYITVRFFIVKNEKGKTVRTYGVTQDITERKRTEEALRESEEKYRGIFENVQDMFYEASIDGIMIEVSPSVELLLKGKYKRDEVIGKSMYDFFKEPAGGEALMRVLQERGFVSDFEITLTNRDGSHIPCSVSSRICFDTQGHPEKIIGSMRDITDLKNASDTLKLAKEKAEANDKLKTTFLNNISHEVRTPLNGILGFAEIMSQPDLSEEEKNFSLSMLFESSDRLLDTITNYIDISLITSGNMTVNKKDFVPAQIVNELSGKYKSLCSARKLELILKIPEHYDNLSVNSDPEIFGKILSHLLSNAIKFTEKGSIKYGYTIREKEFEFFVTDTGIGIGKESLESVFDRFVKEEYGPLKVTEGSGLGLSISKGLAELLGGKIWVESEKGKGSTFFFTIPQSKENKIDRPVLKTDQQNKTIIVKSILVAEDDETNFFYLKTLLKHITSATVIHASNGREAIDKFKQNPDIGLILMDIKMPVMDGMEATRKIKAIKRDIPIIAITAYAMPGDEARMLDAGCDYYLTKPINKKLLLEKIAEYISLEKY